MIVKCRCTTKIDFKDSFKIGKQFYCQDCAFNYVKMIRNKAWEFKQGNLIEGMSRLGIPIYYERKIPTLAKI